MSRAGPQLARITLAVQADLRDFEMTGLVKRFIAVFFRRIVGRYYLLITALSVLLSGLAVWVIATQWNINSDFKALLPRSSEAYQAMEEVGDRVGSGSALFVVIDSPDMEANKAFAEKYSDALRDLDQVALAHYHNKKEFFRDHQLLYLDTEDLQTVHDRLKKKIRDEKKKANPLFVSLGGTGKKKDDKLLETDDLEEKYKDQAHAKYKEYLVADDGYSLTIVVRFVESSTDLEATNALIDKVKEVGQSLDPSTFHPDMQLEYGGGLINRQKEYSSIVDDVQTSALFTVVGLFLVIGLYFRRMRAIGFVLTPLIMGVLWTLALAFAIYGELTTVTVFIFAILLGLGIDFSIHLLSGYDHLRAEGKDAIEALVRTYNTTGKATVIGAFTTFITFLVLSFAQFRGLSQFGQVASVGVLFTLTAMVVVLPSLILTAHRIWPHEHKKKEPSKFGLTPAHWFDEKTARRLAPVALAIAVIFTVLTGAQIPDLRFEENFRQIGEVQWPWAESAEAEKKETPQKSAEKAAAAAASRIAEQATQVRQEVDPDSFQKDREQSSTGDKWTSAVGGMQSSTPTVLLFDDAEKAEKVYHYMAEKKEQGGLDAVQSIGSIYAFLPGSAKQQEARLDKIAEIDELLEDEDLSFLDKDERKQLEDFEKKLEVDKVSAKHLPPWTKRLFRESGPRAAEAAEGEDYAYEYLIYVNSAVDSMVGSQAREFLGQLQEVRQETGIDFRIGSQSYIYTAMLDEIKNDGALMMGIALLVVFFILTLTFRNPLRGLIAFLPLMLGAAWMMGIAAFIGLRLDFFNVIIIPVIIGLGVDDGVHTYYHYRELGRGSVNEVIRKVGTAIVMTSITSAIGFGGLAVTHYDGLQSIGYLAILGITTTLLATLLVLPAILWLGEKYDIKWLVGE